MIDIYQIYYDSYTYKNLGEYFIPYNNTNPERQNEFEYGVMRKLYFKKDWKKISHMGVFSWKFEKKTGAKQKDLIELLNKVQLADVIICNPYPGGVPRGNKKGYENIWDQGEYWHPGIKKISKELFEIAGINKNLIDIKHPRNLECYSNYWIANRDFWDLYMSYSERLYKAAYENKTLRQDLFEKKTHKNQSYFPFVFERVFTTVLNRFSNSFKIQNINLKPPND